MELTRRLLKGLIEESDERNSEGKYSEKDVIGVSTAKNLIPTKAVLDGVNLNNYKLLPPGYFAFVADTSRRGDKMALAYNNTNRTYIVSTWYVVFYIAKNATKFILPEYLFMYFNRSEFDRYARINSWGSAREYFWLGDMENIELDLPSISIQQKYVDVYNAMLENQKSYEYGLDDLKLACDAYIEDLKHSIHCKAIGPYVERYDVRNRTNEIKNVMGVSTSKEFREPTSKVNRNELSNYKIVKPRQISFVQTTHNEKVFAYAFNNTEDDIVVTSVNEVFSVDEDKLLPEYLCMFFNRTEFDRYARFHSWGSARETFTWDDLVKVEIPIADMKIQKSIVDIYKAYKEQKAINEKLKVKIKDICPILIKGSIEEARKAKEA